MNEQGRISGAQFEPPSEWGMGKGLQIYTVSES